MIPRPAAAGTGAQTPFPRPGPKQPTSANLSRGPTFRPYHPPSMGMLARPAQPRSWVQRFCWRRWPRGARRAPPRGVARVIDGDTVDVTTPDGRRERVRVISKTSRPRSLSGAMNST